MAKPPPMIIQPLLRGDSKVTFLYIKHAEPVQVAKQAPHLIFLGEKEKES